MWSRLTVVIIRNFRFTVWLAASTGDSFCHHQQLSFKWIRRHSWLHVLYTCKHSSNSNQKDEAKGPIGWHRSLFPQTSARHQLKLQGRRHGASVSRGVPVKLPACAGTNLHCLVNRGTRELVGTHYSSLLFINRTVTSRNEIRFS